jgi:hypothetical protein
MSACFSSTMLFVLWIFFGKLHTVTKSTQFQYLILPSLTSNCDLQSAGNNSTENYFIITSNLVGDRNNHYEDTGQPPPPALVRDTILQQDAQFREQVQELHRVHEVQVYLMAEMRKRDSAEVATTTCASVNANNESSWAMMIQAPLSKVAECQGSGFGHGQTTTEGNYTGERGYTTSVADVEQGRRFSGGRKPGKRRTFDLEKPPDENMDEDEEESSGEAVSSKVDVETEGVQLRLSSGWAQQAGDQLHQDHLRPVPSISNDILHEAPVCPTPTIATQSFLGGLWGLSLEKKSEADGDCQAADVSSKKEHCSLQLDIDDNCSYHPTKMASSPPSPSEASWTGSTLTRPQEQQYSKNEGTWFQEQQQQHTWAHSAEGVYQVAPAIGIQPPPQTFAPFKITNETMMLFPASRDGAGAPSGFAPPVYNQAYTLAAAAVPVQLHPYEGPITLPGQGLVVSAMNAAAWYTHPVPPVQQGGWQPVNAFQADSGTIYAFPTTAATPLAFNVDLSGGSWTASNSGPAFSPLTIVQPSKVPFKKPPKLVLRQDGTTKEVRHFSPKKDHSPSVSSGEEVGGSLKEKDNSQGEGNPYIRGYEQQVSCANRAFAGWVPKAGAKREREQTDLADQEGEGKLTSRMAVKTQYGDETCVSDGSGSGSGETGVGNVINPGEYLSHLALTNRPGRILPAGNGECVNPSEPGMQQEQPSNAADRWNLPSTDECGNVSDVNEDSKHHHQHCKALKPQHSSGTSDPGQNSTGESIALLESTSKTRSIVEESTVPDARDLSPKSHKSSPPAPVQDSCTMNEDDNPDKLALPGTCPVPKVPPEPAASSALTISTTVFTNFGNVHKPEAESQSISSPKEVLKEQQEANGDAANSVHV